MSQYSLLIARLKQELTNTERTVQRALVQVQKAERSGDQDYYDAAALNLQKFYMGAERIFSEIARDIDEHFPSGPNWHQQLLQQMILENEDVRPPVLSTETYQKLELDYRGFRHVASHLYAFELKSERIRELVNDLPATYALLKRDIQGFYQYLRTLAQQLDPVITKPKTPEQL